MSDFYSHPLLGMAINHSFGGTPPAGIFLAQGRLIHWPEGQPFPDEAQQAQWVAEYETYLASPQCKDDDLMRFLATNGGRALKAVALLGIDKGLWTLAELKAKYRSL